MIQLMVPKNIRTSFIVSVLLLILTFGLTLYSLNRLINKADWLEHTNLVLLRLENILSFLKDAEVGQRGYLLTENPEFLEPYVGSYYRTIQRYKQVRTLTLDNNIQQKRLDTLNLLINNRFNILNRTIELERNGQLESARAIVMNKEGKVLMDRIRALIKRMQAEELRLKAIRYDQVKTSSIITPVLILLATFLSILICNLAYRITKKEIWQRDSLRNQLEQTNRDLQETNAELKKTEAHLKHLNATLETKVEERTLHLFNTKEELRDLNQELFRKNDRLLRINADLDNFIYTASHDLKAPITNIEGLITILKENNCYQEQETRDLINRISLSGEKLKQVVEDLAVVVRVQNELDIAVEKINVEKVIQDIRLSIADLFQASQAQIRVEIRPDAEIVFSKRNFRSIIFNLIHNAIKYRSPARTPEIIIRLEKIPEYTLLSVQDNGLGIDPTKKENVFILFKRLHNHVEGSGVGLFIVKRIMDNAGGKVEVNSRVNEGTTFRLYFPD